MLTQCGLTMDKIRNWRLVSETERILANGTKTIESTIKPRSLAMKDQASTDNRVAAFDLQLDEMTNQEFTLTRVDVHAFIAHNQNADSY